MWLSCLLWALVQQSDAQQRFADPAPPEVQALEAEPSPEARETPGLTRHRAPRPLASGAIVEDWPSFLGPRRDGHSLERPLATAFGPGGPPLVWELVRGQGYASPAVADGRLVFTHRIDNVVHVDCLEAETGRRYWRTSLPCDYAGKYIRNGGPRSTPSIVGDRVYVHGVDGVLQCLELATGRTLWRRNTAVEFEVGDDFFGVVSSPLVVGDLLIQNVGAPKGPSVVAFDRHTGALVWGAGERWGPSCASPVLATLAGAERLCVVAGGESRPPTGGLMVMSPRDGALTLEIPFRSRTYASVNGASPVACGDERLFLTAAYGVGSAVVTIDERGGGEEQWRKRRGLGLEFATPVYEDGLVFAIDGVSGRAGAIVAIDPASGDEVARRSLEFEAELPGDEPQGEPFEFSASVGAGSILRVDDVFLVLGDTGHLVAIRFDAEAEEPSFDVVAEAPLFSAPEAWTPLALSRGLLYVCQNNPARVGKSPERLLCYDLRGAAD